MFPDKLLFKGQINKSNPLDTDTELSEGKITMMEYISEKNARYKINTKKEDYYFTKEIGRGGFGKIVLSESVNDKNDRHAIKIIRKKNQETHNDTMTEIYIMTSLKHDNIVKCHGWFDDEYYYYLLLDYIKGCDLFDLADKKELSITTIKYILVQLLDAMIYLRELNIIHRDIKPENIIVDNYNRIYLCDFGLAGILETQESILTETRTIGTIEYMTPESLKSKQYDISYDIWSFGVLVYELCFRDTPFYLDGMTNDDFDKLDIYQKQSYDLKRHEDIIDNIKNYKIFYPNKLEYGNESKYGRFIRLLEGIFVLPSLRMTPSDCYKFIMRYI